MTCLSPKLGWGKLVVMHGYTAINNLLRVVCETFCMQLCQFETKLNVKWGTGLWRLLVGFVAHFAQQTMSKICSCYCRCFKKTTAKKAPLYSFLFFPCINLHYVQQENHRAIKDSIYGLVAYISQCDAAPTPHFVIKDKKYL